MAEKGVELSTKSKKEPWLFSFLSRNQVYRISLFFVFAVLTASLFPSGVNFGSEPIQKSETRLDQSVVTAADKSISSALSSPSTSSQTHSSEISEEEKSCACQIPRPKGVVDDCCCEFETVDSLNQDVLHPLLQHLVKTPFFRFFKVRLYCDCPFWPSQGMCSNRDCSVMECAPNEVPQSLLPGSENSEKFLADAAGEKGDPSLSAVDRTLDPAGFKGWSVVDNPWTADDETDNSEMIYVNLVLNPERYTGYGGEEARKIWQAIYMENCFTEGLSDSCTERRVFFRLISGLHSSINMHVYANFLLPDANGGEAAGRKEHKKWGPHLELFRDKVLAFPERIHNLYFTFLFVLRAVLKASPFLSEADYDTGNPQSDALSKELICNLTKSQRLLSACPVPFDEAAMWKGEEGAELKRTLQDHFRNISLIMDCVGCEKCRMWGKLQVLGLGTALKILFSVPSSSSERERGREGEPVGWKKGFADDGEVQLQKNEVIALLNLLSHLSESVEYTNKFIALLEENERDKQGDVRVSAADSGGISSSVGKERSFRAENKRIDVSGGEWKGSDAGRTLFNNLRPM